MLNRRLNEPSLHSLPLHSLAVLHRHAIRIRVGIELIRNAVHHHAADTLCLGHGAVLMSQEQGLQVDNLLTQLRYLTAQCVVLAAENLHLGLQVGEPLLLALPAFQCRHPLVC